MTKEEILSMTTNKVGFSDFYENIYKAMDIYAKQEAEKELRDAAKQLKFTHSEETCNPETCNCSKSSALERKHNPYHDWVNYSMIKPPVGVEVLAQSDEWVSEDYNKKGIRVGFQNEDAEGEFITAKWDNSGDTYENCEQHKPVRWKFF